MKLLKYKINKQDSFHNIRGQNDIMAKIGIHDKMKVKTS